MSDRKKVLVLGAGLVAKPLVDELLSRDDVDLTLAALDVERAEALPSAAVHSDRARAADLDVGRRRGPGPGGRGGGRRGQPPPRPPPPGGRPPLRRARGAAGHHLLRLERDAGRWTADGPRRGVLLLNECGLDPGIDHMMAVDVIRRVERAGGEVVSFVSYCGGLPAPETADNPLRYKLSWSPRGVLVAARSPVRFLSGRRGGRAPEPVPARRPGARCRSPGWPELEGYPNRDSVPYRLALRAGARRGLLRGTLRYPGWCDTMEAMLRLGLLETSAYAGLGPSYCDLLDQQPARGSGPMPKRIARFLELPEDHPVLDRLAWLGLFSQQPMPDEARSPLDALAELFEDKLRYDQGEHDMVALEHRFVVVEADGRRAHRSPRAWWSWARPATSPPWPARSAAGRARLRPDPRREDGAHRRPHPGTRRDLPTGPRRPGRAGARSDGGRGRVGRAAILPVMSSAPGPSAGLADLIAPVRSVLERHPEGYAWLSPSAPGHEERRSQGRTSTSRSKRSAPRASTASP